MNDAGLKRILRLVLLGFLVYIAVRYFWPVLLVIALYIGWQYYRTKKAIEQAQKEAESVFVSQNAYEQAPRVEREPGEIIDAEFTMKEKEQESMHG